MHNTKTYIAGRTEDGLDVYRNLSVLATGQSIKTTRGVVYGYFIANNAAAVRYVKLYDKASAPTVGTDTPKLTLGFPANSAANVYLGPGIQFDAGVGIAAVQGVADADTTAPAANDVVVNILYK